MIHHCSFIHQKLPLFTMIHQCTISHHDSPLFSMIHHCSPIRHYAPLSPISHHYAPTHHCSPLFTISHHDGQCAGILTQGTCMNVLATNAYRHYANAIPSASSVLSQCAHCLRSNRSLCRKQCFRASWHPRLGLGLQPMAKHAVPEEWSGSLAIANIGLSGQAIMGTKWPRHRAKLFMQLTGMLEYDGGKVCGLCLCEVGSLQHPLTNDVRERVKELIEEVFENSSAAEHGRCNIVWPQGAHPRRDADSMAWRHLLRSAEPDVSLAKAVGLQSCRASPSPPQEGWRCCRARHCGVQQSPASL